MTVIIKVSSAVCLNAAIAIARMRRRQGIVLPSPFCHVRRFSMFNAGGTSRVSFVGS